MRKILFGSASAILAVVGFSAFKNVKNTTTSYYWFGFGVAYASTTPISSVTPGLPRNIHHSNQVTYLGFGQVASFNDCNLFGPDLCIAGYTFDQLNFTSGKTVITTIKTNASTLLPVPPRTLGSSSGSLPVKTI